MKQIVTAFVMAGVCMGMGITGLCLAHLVPFPDRTDVLECSACSFVFGCVAVAIALLMLGLEWWIGAGHRARAGDVQ